MPITQERMISLVKAGQYYAELVNRARANIETLYTIANTAVRVLESEENLTEQQQRALDTVWETVKSISAPLTTIDLQEFEMFKIITREDEHFSNKSIRTHNTSQRNYMRRRRHKSVDEINNNEANIALKDPSRNDEQEQQATLVALHQHLYSIDKESWAVNEIDKEISEKLPEQSSTDFLNRLVRSKRVAHIKATNRYVVENPNIIG